MRIVRLSRTSPIPAHNNDAPKTPISSAPRPEYSRMVHLLTLFSRIILPPLLALALVLTLLPLLLPTVDHHSLTFFTIQTSGYEQGSSAVAINGNDNSNLGSSLAKASDDVDEDITEPGIHLAEGSSAEAKALLNALEQAGIAKREVGIVENKAARWLGKDGPSIYVGAIQVCSRRSANEEVLCTSSSKAASHAKPLPLHLPLTLLPLPKTPRTPILLLVSAIFSVIASFIFIAGLVPWRCSCSFNFLRRKPPLESTPHRALFIEDSDSDSDGETGRRPRNSSSGEGRECQTGRGMHCSFFCVVIVALALALGALIELRDVHRAQEAWNDDDAKAVGLVFKLGALTYLLPILPAILIIILQIAAAPSIYLFFKRQFRSCPADDEFTIETGQPVIKISPPSEGSVGSGWDETPITDPAPPAVQSPSSLPTAGKDSDKVIEQRSEGAFGGAGR